MGNIGFLPLACLFTLISIVAALLDVSLAAMVFGFMGGGCLVAAVER